VLSALLIETALLAFRSSQVALAAFVRQLAYQDSVPQATADGAQEVWIYRMLNASAASIGFEASDPLGVGVTGGWSNLGTATASAFPGLASVPAGGANNGLRPIDSDRLAHRRPAGGHSIRILYLRSRTRECCLWGGRDLQPRWRW
jgi:hypothetical protein